jgi:inner membrane protein
MNSGTSFLKKHPLLIKVMTIFFLIILLMIPTAMIQDLVREREGTEREAINEVSSKWANQQTIIGPVITVPYINNIKTVTDEAIPGTTKTQSKTVITKTVEYKNFLPANLKIAGEIIPERRYRGIYEVVVYTSSINFSGDFSELSFKDLNIPREQLLLDKAFISLGISDLRGIKEQIKLNWNQKKLLFEPGTVTTNIFPSGINTRVPILISSDNDKSEYKFSFNLNLKGSNLIYFAPMGKETDIKIKSGWNNPSFDGAFLPEQHRIDNHGFEANWKVLNLNRNFPQSWVNAQYDVNSSIFGVKLLLPVRSYQKITRCIKYAFLIICLTFLVFLFIEILKKQLMHPIHYILVGIGLCLFYTLLLSISEYLNFAIAYLIASFMTITLITGFTGSILKSKSMTMLIFSILSILYGFIYIIIQLQDYSLLMGSFGLFFILAAIKFISRKIDWNQPGSSERKLVD